MNYPTTLLRRPPLLLIGLLLILSPCSLSAMQFKALVFSDKSDKWHHPNVPVARESFEALARKHFFELTWVETAEAFSDQEFAAYDVIVFISASPCGLDDDKRKEFQAYVAGGGGVVGVHFSFAFEDAERQWPWWEELVGNVFVCHPPQQSGIMTNEAPDFPACLHLPEKWLWTDEWYTFKLPFREDLNVVLTVDEDSYYPRPQDVMGEFHPIAWYHEPGGGRLFYTSLGHITESYRDPLFLQHIYGGMLWAVGERDPKW